MCMRLDCSCHGDYIKLCSGDGGEKPSRDVEKTPTKFTFWNNRAGRRRRHLRPPLSCQALACPSKGQGPGPSCAISGKVPSASEPLWWQWWWGRGQASSYPKLLSPQRFSAFSPEAPHPPLCPGHLERLTADCGHSLALPAACASGREVEPDSKCRRGKKTRSRAAVHGSPGGGESSRVTQGSGGQRWPCALYVFYKSCQIKMGL